MNFLEILLIITLLVAKISSQSKSCDYYQAVKPGIIYSIMSPNFSQNYQLGTDCRWAAEAPAGHQVSLSCNQVKLPTTFACFGDRILVSNTGRADLRDGKKHCGASSFSETSVSTRMTLALKTGRFSWGGSFKCSLKTVTNSCSCGLINRGRIGTSQARHLYINFEQIYFSWRVRNANKRIPKHGSYRWRKWEKNFLWCNNQWDAIKESIREENLMRWFDKRLSNGCCQGLSQLNLEAINLIGFEIQSLPRNSSSMLQLENIDLHKFSIFELSKLLSI